LYPTLTTRLRESTMQLPILRDGSLDHEATVSHN
jgi:hypothetical protein